MTAGPTRRWAIGAVVLAASLPGKSWAQAPPPPRASSTSTSTSTSTPTSTPTPPTPTPTPTPTSTPPRTLAPLPNPADVSDEGDVPMGPPVGARPAHRASSSLSAPVDYTTRRYEPAGFPIFGGDSDIGFEFGAVGTLSYFSDGVKPYRWNMDLLLAASVKQGPNGPEVAQQAYQWNIDAPGLFGGRVRLNPQVAFTRTINEGWFGLGDASGFGPPAGATNPGRFDEFVNAQFQVQPIARVHLIGPVSAMFGLRYRYVAPSTYSGSELAEEEATRNADGSPLLYGTGPLSLIAPAAGFVYDTRDNEIFPRRGMFHTVGVRFEEGIPFSDQVRYGSAGAIFSGFVPIVGPLVLAARLVGDLQFGNVPFYDLFMAGPFDLKEAPGGSAGIRGVPVGRYSGPIKVIGNVELRAMLFNFTLLKQKFSIGTDAFFDTGRVWSDYSFHSKLDGSGVGLKYGVGGGAYILWGQAAMIRIEAAYSPDAVAENPTLPIGLYVEDGTMF